MRSVRKQDLLNLMRDQIPQSHEPGHAMRDDDKRGRGDQFHGGESQEKVPMDAIFRDDDVITEKGNG